MQRAALDRSDADRLIDRLRERWGALPAVEREIDGWDLLDQLDFIEEWNLVDAMVRQLDAIAAADALTRSQRERYQRLHELIAAHRPIIERLRRT